MATLTLGGKTVLTQTGSDEPVLGSNLTGSPALNLSGSIFPAGHIIQIKGKHDSTQNAISISTTPLAIGLNISITPTSASNTIIIHGFYYCGNTNFNGGVGLARHLSSDSFSDSAARIGDAGGTDGSSIRAGNFFNADDPVGTTYSLENIPFTYYDFSYNTTQPITYTIYGEAANAQTFLYNRAGNGTGSGLATSSIFAYEVVGSIT